MDARLPKTLGRFEVDRVLGRGAMGVVYLAHDPLIGRAVAIKLLTTEPGIEGADRTNLQARFEREFRSAGTLTHPNIITVYDVGQQDGHSFIAMEFVDGDTLEAVLRSRRAVSFEEISGLAAQVGSALDYAHQRGVIHRDVKPSNIMLDGDGTAKLTDFGVAKVTLSTLTRTGTIVGSPAYMAPEQVTGEEISGAADQFALGVVLYELLTGERPFEGTNPTVVLYRIVHEEPLSPRRINPQLPAAINQVVLKALSKSPEKRYGSCSELAVAVRQALAQIPGDALAPTRKTPDTVGGARRPRALRRRRRIGWVAAAAISVVIAFLAWLAFPRASREATPAGPDEPTPAASRIEAMTGATTLSVMTDKEGLRIFVDGEDTGSTAPAETRLEGSAGETRRVELWRGEELVAQTTVTLGGEERQLWRPQVAPARVRLRIVSRPAGARLKLDGEILDSPTPTEISVLPDQSYELRLELGGYRTEGMDLVFENLSREQQERAELEFPLTPSVPPGHLVLATDYPLQVLVRSRRFGPRSSHRIPLPPGSHPVRLLSPAVFLDQAQTVQIRSGSDLTVTVPRLVQVTVRANPSNCRVRIDGQPEKVTPLNDLPITVGRHEFSFLWPATGRRLQQVEYISETNRVIQVRQPN